MNLKVAAFTVSEKSSNTPRGGGGGGGGTLYFHTYVGSDHFFGFKILNFNILGFFLEK